MNSVVQLITEIISAISSYLNNKNIPKTIVRTKNFLLINKAFDLAINCNDKSKFTLQTYLRNNYRAFVNKKLFHEFYFPHRLDFATSGVICIPLNKTACKIASEAFEKRSARKYYVALCRGLFSNSFIVLQKPVGTLADPRDVDRTSKMCTSDNGFCAGARDSETAILVLEDGLYDDYPATKILIRPITGRRHQIRVHCCSLGHTIIGDYTYSNGRDIKPDRMYLHAMRLILPNKLDDIDVSTGDPFTSKDVKNWRPVRTFHGNVDAAITFLDSLIDLEKPTNPSRNF